MSFIEMKNICKKYAGADKNSVTDFSLSVEEGEFIAFVGPSGCGKSTTLRMIAGFEEITSGDFYIDGKRMNAVLPRDRGISMVFQNYALYPHMTVEKNISYGLKNMKVPAAEIKKKVDWAIDILGLSEYRYRKPKNLSGGQRQRVALGRAIVKDQKLFLMDEPLSNLDAKLRQQMRIELIELHKRLGTTFIYVTHDQIEAMSMGDNIILMDKGVIMQRSTPKEMYHNPQNVYTAQFIGTPPMNIVDNMVPDIKIGFRPEKTSFLDPGEALLDISGRIITKEQLGAEMNYSVETAYGKVIVKTEEDIESDRCRLYVREQHLFAFAKDGKRMEVTPEIRNAVRNLEKGA